MMKPIIGIMPLWDDKKDSLWMLPGYLEGIKLAGGVPLIFPFLEDEADVNQLFDLCDGFLFTGGHDVSPDIYHEEILEGTFPCSKRDRLESIVLKKALEEDKPVLGICRGIQFINAFLGGSLYQDLPTQHPSDINHRQSAPYDLPSHKVFIQKDSPLYQCLGVEEYEVNSCHHQAIKFIAPGLKAMATSQDHLIEAFYMPGKQFLWAVQWHPEFSYLTNQSSILIFRAFIDAINQVY